MKRHHMIVLVVALGCLGTLLWSPARPVRVLAQGSDLPDKPPRYVGVDHCAQCHSAEGTNYQMQVWEKGPHARAYETLDSDRAREVAEKAGVKGHPQEAAQCLKCHTTGAGDPSWRFVERFNPEEGVSCEACHGPGEHYAEIDHMIMHRAAVARGLKEPAKSVCLQCHNEESPTYKPFDYVAGVEVIQHPLPRY